MNIAIISPQIYPFDTGGVEIFNYFLAKSLASHGHKIWVFTFHDYDWKQKNIINVKLQKRLLLFRKPSTIFCTLLKLKKLRGQIDILHLPYTSNSLLPYLALLSNKLFGIRYLISIHGGGMYPWRAKIFHKIFFQQASGIVAVSTTIKEEYEKRSGRIIKVIPPLIPFLESKSSKHELRRTYGFNDNDIIILTLGSIKKIKGSETLLNAFLKLKKDYIKKMHLKLLYVGDGTLKSSLEKIVQKVGLNSCIKFFGTVPYEKVPDMYKLADIYTITSLFEGTPKSLLEAMFNDLPVIGSDTNGINNIITNNLNGLLFKVSDENDLMVKLKILIENEDLRNRLSNSVKKFVSENYDCEKTFLEFIEVYRNIIETINH